MSDKQMTSETTALVAPVVSEQTALMRVGEIQERFMVVQQLLKTVMKPDIDYGCIQGCGEKPMLFKPGAEVICMMFRLSPKLDTRSLDLPGGHREYQVTLTLVHAVTGQFWGQGIGMASTMESKHRYRGTQVEPTGKPLPRGYWDAKKEDFKKAETMIGGPEFTAKKIDGNWQICRKLTEKQENQDPADQFNTVLKMAKKRALVDAVLTATAASRIFSQDMEDLEEMIEQTPDLDEKDADAKAANGGNASTAEKNQVQKSLDADKAKFMDWLNSDGEPTFGVNLKHFEEIVHRDIKDWNGIDMEKVRRAVRELLAERKAKRDESGDAESSESSSDVPPADHAAESREQGKKLF